MTLERDSEQKVGEEEDMDLGEESRTYALWRTYL
jgi:hypothetical protein